MPDRARQQAGPPASGPIEFEVDGEVFVLPQLPTRVWLDALVLQAPGCWWQLIPHQLDGDGDERLFHRMLDHRVNARSGQWTDGFDLDDLEEIAQSVLGQACGVDFHAACTLAGMAYADWLLFDGWSYTRGIDPLAQPIGRLLTGVYAWRRSLCTKESELNRLDGEIWAPGPATTISGRERNLTSSSWTAEREEASFLAALGALGARGHG